MRSIFKIGPGFEDVPKFDEAVLEEDMKNPMDQERKVIRMAPVVVGDVDGELSLSDGENDSDASRKNHDGDGPGTADPG
jgi:hypothetical protein